MHAQPSMSAPCPAPSTTLIRLVIKDVQRYKTVLCQTYTATGQCPYTWKCQFAHGTEELRPRWRGSNQSVAGRSGQFHGDIFNSADNWGKPVGNGPNHATTTEPNRNSTGSSAAEPGCYEIVASGWTEPAEPSNHCCVECTADILQAGQGALDASTGSPPAPPAAVQVVRLPRITHLMREPPVLQELSANAALPLELNHATGKVEASCNRGPVREASANTLLIRRQMSCLLDELSVEASAKRRVQW